MDRVAASMSLDRADSELNRVNREAPGTYYRVTDHDLFRAIALAVDYAKASDGAYDPTREPFGWRSVVLERGLFAVHFSRPEMQLDLAGLVEGYAIDVAARKFVRTGSLAGLIRLGPHAYAWGDPPGDDPWWIDVHDPRRAPGEALLRLRIETSRGLGVSGTGGERALVVDPRTGKPSASDVVVAVAIADSAADAIAISRALLVGGTAQAGQMLSERTRRVEAVLLVRSGDSFHTLASASLAGRLESSERLDGQTLGDVRFLLPPSELPGRLD